MIPARLESQRLPRKMLLKLRGDKSVLQCTYERVMKSTHLANAKLVIATDSGEIYKEASRFGAECIMTSSRHTSGSERAGEVLAKLNATSNFDVVVNVQGDEPFLEPHHLDLTVDSLLNNDWVHASTVAVRINHATTINDESKVKVVLDIKGQALYFSRSMIPVNAKQWLRHIGIYAFRPKVLQDFVQHPRTPLEQAENLEQLRLLEMGYKMHVSIVDTCEFAGIDTLKDYNEARAKVMQQETRK